MMAIVMVFLSAMTASSMPDDLRALDEGIHYDIERRRLDAGDEARLVDAALPQREAVGEHPHAGAGQPRQIVRAGARPCREHAVLDEEQGHNRSARRSSRTGRAIRSKGILASASP